MFVVLSLEKRLRIFESAVRNNLKKIGKALFLGRKIYLEVYLVGSRFMKKNVLSYPAPKEMLRPDIKGRALGEIYLNPTYIKKNKENLLRMLVHGFLHLLGYNHKKKSDRIRMEKKEAITLSKLANS